MTNEHMQRNGQACHTCAKFMGTATGKPHVMRVVQKIGMKSSMDEVCASRIAP